MILIRHAEKPGSDGPPLGVNRHGHHDEHSLSVRGWTRAGALAAVLAHAPRLSGSDLVTPTRIFATKPTASYRSKRERDTATPTALRLGVSIIETLTHGDESELVATILAEPGPALVVWHHARMPDLVGRFPLVNPKDVPKHWPDDRFDLYWVLTRVTPDPVTYRFVVAGQDLLEGDAPPPTAAAG